jgi:hypothetical protein
MVKEIDILIKWLKNIITVYPILVISSFFLFFFILQEHYKHQKTKRIKNDPET